MIIVEKIVNAITGEETIVEREETIVETKARETLEKEIAKKQKEKEAKAQAKAALLERLGITEDEAKLLLA